MSLLVSGRRARFDNPLVIMEDSLVKLWLSSLLVSQIVANDGRPGSWPSPCLNW
jgi:hypothetical protein